MEMDFLGIQPVSSWKAAHWLEISHRWWGLGREKGALREAVGAAGRGQPGWPTVSELSIWIDGGALHR